MTRVLPVASEGNATIVGVRGKRHKHSHRPSGWIRVDRTAEQRLARWRAGRAQPSPVYGSFGGHTVLLTAGRGRVLILIRGDRLGEQSAPNSLPAPPLARLSGESVSTQALEESPNRHRGASGIRDAPTHKGNGRKCNSQNWG